MPVHASHPAVSLATYLTDLNVGRGLFRLHPIVNDRCACGDDACTSVGKHPAERWGATATRNPRAVERKFRLHQDAGIGLATGRGLLVLDFDASRGGLDSLAQLERRFSAVSDAPRVLTGISGDHRGRHAYLQVAEGVYVPSRANALRDYPGVDVRCAGGFVVAPPSPHRSGARYEWEQEPASLPGCPDALVSLLQERKTKDEQGGVDRVRSKRPLSPRMLAMLRDGIPLEGGQRTNLCSLSRALLEVPRTVDETTDLIWTVLSTKSDWSAEPWTQEQVREIVVDIEQNARRPALRTPRIRIKERS